MSEFYINSVKSNLNWKKLDVSDIELHQKDDKIQIKDSKKSLRDNYSDHLEDTDWKTNNLGLNSSKHFRRDLDALS